MEGLLSPWHIAIVVVVALLVFGPKRLPELGSSLGKAIAGFKNGLNEGQEELQSALREDSESASSPVPPETSAALAAAASGRDQEKPK